MRSNINAMGVSAGTITTQGQLSKQCSIVSAKMGSFSVPKNFAVGDQVDGLCTLPNGSQRWFPGEITALGSPGTNVYTVTFKDGDVHADKPAQDIRPTKRKGSLFCGSGASLTQSTDTGGSGGGGGVSDGGGITNQMSAKRILSLSSSSEQLAPAASTYTSPNNNNSNHNSTTVVPSPVRLPRSQPVVPQLPRHPYTNHMPSRSTSQVSPVAGVAELSLSLKTGEEPDIEGAESPRSEGEESVDSDLSDNNVFVIPSVFGEEGDRLRKWRSMSRLEAGESVE